MNDWTGGLLLLAVVGIPIALFLRYISRPVNDVPRDVVAMMGKAEVTNPVHVLASEAGEDLIDESADG